MDAVDRLHLPPEEQDPRFEVLYFFKNIERNEHVRLKVRVNEGEDIPSIMKVYQGAEWGERFVWDFYGVVFAGGIKRRMLMYEEFVGHPLRKDYPLRGRQNLTPERPLKDIYRGPGTNGVQD
jgi:NADH-quinone oxidoreductase subunit C